MDNTINPKIQENGNVNIADEVISVISSLINSILESTLVFSINTTPLLILYIKRELLSSSQFSSI